MPPPPLPPAQHAYVVEYRALDRCFPPSCAFKSRDVFGWADELQPDGDRGSNIQFGKHGAEFFELFFHRGKIIAPGETFSFELPATPTPSELDVYLSAEEERNAYAATITFQAAPPARPFELLETHPVSGITEFINPPRREAEFAHERRAFSHVRLPLPSRDGRTIRVEIKNTGTAGLGVGSPLVMKRVEGRAPRQALWAIYDAVPYPLFDAILHGKTGDPQTEWLHEYVSKNGTYFPNGLTPGLLTTSYARRLFRAGYYNDVGEPLIRRDFQEPVPEITRNVIADLGQQGVQTFVFAANFVVLPTYTYLGWDGGYDSELSKHPYAVMARYQEWVKEHPDDDAFVLWWIASTHTPWPDTRPVLAKPPVPALPPGQLNPQVFPQTWTNALEGTDRLKGVLDAAHAASPNASRMLYISADHGRGFSMRHETRAFRSPITGVWPGAMSHGVGGDSEEMRTPFALVYEGAETPPGAAGRVFDADISILATLRALENFFHVNITIPDTRVFDSTAFTSSDKVDAHWDDDFIAGVGLDQVFRFVRGKWAYTEFAPRIDIAPIWDKQASIQRMLMGTPYRSGRFLAEELYDQSVDPIDYVNVAGDNPEVVLDLRRRAADWLGTYYDDASHARYRYTLTFPERSHVVIRAPRPFEAWVDGKPAPMRTPTSVEISGTRVELQEIDETVGVIELSGEFASRPITLRCASNALPVDATSAARPRVNLALGRTNCPVQKTDHVSAMKDSVMFSFGPAQRAQNGDVVANGAGGGGMIDKKELMAGMKKWGYVRDIEKKP